MSPRPSGLPRTQGIGTGTCGEARRRYLVSCQPARLNELGHDFWNAAMLPRCRVRGCPGAQCRLDPGEPLRKSSDLFLLVADLLSRFLFPSSNLDQVVCVGRGDNERDDPHPARHGRWYITPRFPMCTNFLGRRAKTRVLQLSFSITCAESTAAHPGPRVAASSQPKLKNRTADGPTHCTYLHNLAHQRHKATNEESRLANSRQNA